MNAQGAEEKGKGRGVTLRTPGKRKAIAALSLALVFALGMSMPAFAAPPFELDGNATSNNFPGDDWDVVNQTPPGGNPIARTGLIVDLPEPETGFNQFQSGGRRTKGYPQVAAHRRSRRRTRTTSRTPTPQPITEPR